MSAWIEIIIAIIIVGLIGRYINYVTGILSILPASLMAFVLLGISISLALFVIHRK